VGSGIQPFNAWLLLRGLRTLPMRLEHISKSTRVVVDFLKSHPRVERLIFPFDPTFPQHDLAIRQMKGASGLLSFYLKANTIGAVEAFCQKLRHFRMAVSWGGHESLVIPRCASLDPADFDPGNPDHRLVRVYVGLESPEYLVADLKQALEE